jgi:hypothetical protein
MRAQKVIPLGDNRAVVLNELRVRDARKLIPQIKELGQYNIVDLITDRFSELEALLGDCIVMPDGERLDDLSASEAVPVIEGLLEVNASFLDLLALLGLLEWVPKTHSQTLTEPVPFSSSEGTPT